MSQQQNNEVNGMALGVIFVGACFFAMFIFVYAIACFVALVLSGVALRALKGPVTIYKWTTTPEEARVFLWSGFVGLTGLSAIILFSSALFQFRVNPDYWFHILLGGYSFGALGIGSMVIDARQKEAAAALLLPPAPPSSGTSVMPSPPNGPWTPGAAEAPFRFASWEDEFADGEAETTEVVEIVPPPPPVSPHKRRPRRSMPIYRSEQP